MESSIVTNAKLFMVGAGGIGCELLKTLVMSGFEDIELIDLDTIDVSNLNRQFLFHKQHVGMSKAKVARDAALAMRPTAKIVAHHGNVMAPEFDVEFFSKFSVVLNALDNLAARRHVNRMCLAASVPLVESGTAGYLGQASVHVKGVTSCYECEAKAAPKGFPTCTITNTPSKPVHCIVWAKELPFQKLFGDKSNPSDLDTVLSAPTNGDSERAEGVKGETGEASTSGQDAEDFFTPREGEELSAFARRVYDRLFGHNVAETLKMEDMWRTRAKPTPHFLFDVLSEDDKAAASEPTADIEREGEETNGGREAKLSAAAKLGLRDEHKVWSLEENTRLFLEAVKMFFERRSKDIGSLTFDKDDNLAVEFVVAASNIRAHSFGIPLQSLFQVKGIAGSIVHAVATTNAIVAGLAALHALRVLKDPKRGHKMVWCSRHKTATGKLLDATDADLPLPTCHACSQSSLVLEVNTDTATLGSLVSSIIKPQIGVAYPTVTSGDTLLYEEGADLDPAEVESYSNNLKKRLSEFGKSILHGSVLTVEDYHQHFKCDIHIKHRADIDANDHPSGMILHGAEDALASSQSKSLQQNGEGKDSAEADLPTDEGGATEEDDEITEIKVGADESDDECEMLDGPPSSDDVGVKRSRENDLSGEREAKKARSNVVVIDDD